MKPNIKLFVYGTLMRGETNHHFMGDALFLSLECTKAQFSLYHLGHYPAMVEMGKQSIQGELFLVEIDQLFVIDQLEECPEYYYRKEIELITGERVCTYLMPMEIIRRHDGVIMNNSWKRTF